MPLISSFFIVTVVSVFFVLNRALVFLPMLLFDVWDFEVSTGIGFEKGVFPYFFQIDV
jgi:hypothetical protein